MCNVTVMVQGLACNSILLGQADFSAILTWRQTFRQGFPKSLLLHVEVKACGIFPAFILHRIKRSGDRS